MLDWIELEQFTDIVVHVNNTLKVFLNENPLIESVAIIVMALVVPAKLGSDEFIVIELDRLNQAGYGDTDQEAIPEVPAGLVTVVGRV